MPGDEPKIFIDEGWKSQVQREKEELARKLAEKPAEPEPPAAEGEPEGEDTPFNMLVGTLATQAMYALGLIAPPDAQQVHVDLEQAQVSIIFLKSLQEKTAGNLTPDEKTSLDTAARELEGAFMARVQQIQQQAMRQTGVDPLAKIPPQF
ncbi:MAG: DUF1844 domain-containing protein [Candidatus Hydrogenedentes bacterium]|nr:DUF1844 domain-containing protein [Candidatus Hydrogenedentota bacterium]